MLAAVHFLRIPLHSQTPKEPSPPYVLFSASPSSPEVSLGRLMEVGEWGMGGECGGWGHVITSPFGLSYLFYKVRVLHETVLEAPSMPHILSF